MNHYYDPSAEPDARYDHLDDLGQFDAATIREMTGYETDGSNEDFTADAITARRGGVAIQGFMLDSNEKGGLDHGAWLAANRDPVQAQTNHEGLRKVRQAIETSRTTEEA